MALLKSQWIITNFLHPHPPDLSVYGQKSQNLLLPSYRTDTYIASYSVTAEPVYMCYGHLGTSGRGK